MSFHIGQVVECIDDKPLPGFEPWDAPIFRGRKYTIAAVRSSRGRECVDLREVCRPTRLPFLAIRFRPIIERKTDTSAQVEKLKQIARDMTKHKPVKITERA